MVIDDPVWNGLTDRQITLLKSACDLRINTCTKKNQNPLFETAVFYVLLYTGLREFELSSLTLRQYYDNGFHDLKRKGEKVSRRINLPSEAKEKLDAYLIHRFEENNMFDLTKLHDMYPPEPLFLTQYGNPLNGRAIQYVMERLSNEASKNLPKEEKFKAAPHQLRHTFLKHIADKHGVHVAQ